MRGDLYEPGDLVEAVKVADGTRVWVPESWLDYASPFAGSYTPPGGDGSPEVEEPEVEEPEVDKTKAKPRPRRASDA